MNSKSGILKRGEFLILFISWLAIIAAPVFIFQVDNVIIWERVVSAWLGLLPFFILFLINHFLLVPLFLFKNNKSLYLIFVIILVIIFSSSLFFLEKPGPNGPPPHEGRQHPPPDRQSNTEFQQRPPPPRPAQGPFALPPLVNTFIISILIIGFDTGLRMMVRWSKLEQEKTLLEKENAQNQLAFLRNQVSPHFFMNTLNNIHALIDVNAEEAKEAIIKLSKLMRHLLYDSEVEQVPLAKELEFITSYANLMKLRFSDNVQINLNMPDKVPAKLIPPLLFTSFVENAFKHGISYQNPSFIDISFLMSDEYLTFEIRNSIPDIMKEDPDTGIGLENSIKRLDILYGKNYKLDIENQDKEYKLTLRIPV